MLDALFHAASLLDTSGVEEAQELPCVGSLRSPVEGTAAHYLLYRPQVPCVGILKASCPKELTLRR